MHFLGVGVPRDKAAGLAWYRKAADQGCAEAQCSLGLALYNGDGVPVDEAESVVWYRKAAEQGHAGAQYTLAYAYSYGRGVPVDKTTAEGWYRKAADQGHAKANAQFQCAETTPPPIRQSNPPPLHGAAAWFTTGLLVRPSFPLVMTASQNRARLLRLEAVADSRQ
jgi:hypothetical protein